MPATLKTRHFPLLSRIFAIFDVFFSMAGPMANLTLIRAVDFKARNYNGLDRLKKYSLDFYAAIRSLYRQRRVHVINNRESPVPVTSKFSAPQPEPFEQLSEAQ